MSTNVKIYAGRAFPDELSTGAAFQIANLLTNEASKPRLVVYYGGMLFYLFSESSSICLLSKIIMPFTFST